MGYWSSQILHTFAIAPAIETGSAGRLVRIWIARHNPLVFGLQCFDGQHPAPCLVSAARAEVWNVAVTAGGARLGELANLNGWFEGGIYLFKKAVQVQCSTQVADAAQQSEQFIIALLNHSQPILQRDFPLFALKLALVKVGGANPHTWIILGYGLFQ
ncbi:MAG: hypothetical protein RR897_00895 [Pseudomonas sp.]